MKTLIVIPARYASTRYPGKPLVQLTGASGLKQTLIERSWRAATSVQGADRVVVATDDDRIKSAAEGFGADVVMTSESCQNGTERCAEALTALGEDYDIVVNLQGDAPLTPHWFVEDLVAALSSHPTAQVATPVLRTDAETLESLLLDRREGRVGGTTAVFAANGEALYFSKEVIPYRGKIYTQGEETPVWHHVGVYAYRPSVLAEYPSWPTGTLESLEGLEQLRFLERNAAVLCVPVEARGRQFWELNNPEDVPKLEAMMKAMDVD